MKNRGRTFLFLPTLIFGFASILMAGCTPAGTPGPATPLRLSVSLTAPELATFEARLDAVRAAHPEWEIILETTPQSGLIEKITTQLASDTLPDVMRLPGLNVQQWIRRDAFFDLTNRVDESAIDLADFYPGPLEQFRWEDQVYGLPDTAAPDLIFYNTAMFDDAGLDYPDQTWNFEDMRTGAILLTLDGVGRNPSDPDFDPEDIQQWGWKSGVTFYWQRTLLSAFGGEVCSNPDCTAMNFTSPEILQAVEWWSSFVHEDYAALYDPYSGGQTGIPGDPFLSGKVAMGVGGYFLLGQLKSNETIRFGITEPLLNRSGGRLSSVSTNGYVISAGSEHPEEAWALVQVLMSPEFLSETWGAPGHSVPARRSVATSNLDPSLTPEEREVVLSTMEYGDVFRPYTAIAFEVHARTSDLFVQAMKGDLPVHEAMTRVEEIANELLNQDRSP